MYANRPSVIPLAQNPASDHAQSAAGANANAVAAAVGATALPSTTLAALGAAASASAAVPAMEYVAPFADDMLGIIAGYLPSEDQLIFRMLNRAAKKETDRQIETLSMTPGEAMALITDTTRLSNLKRLTLSDCDPVGLPAFLDALSKTHYPPFELVLIEEENNPPFDLDVRQAKLNALDTNILHRLSTMPLSGLTLQPNYTFDLRNTSGLAAAQYPISINLERVSNHKDFFPEVTQIASLTSLSVGKMFLFINDVTALGTHPSLTSFKTGEEVFTEYLFAILANPRLTTLSLSRVVETSDDVGEAFRGHPSITSLQLLSIEKPALLRAIFANPLISSLSLSTRCLHASEMHHLAKMPSLRAFTLVEGDARSPEVDEESMVALSKKPLDTLRFEGARMSDDALAIAASAHASFLSFEHNRGMFNQTSITALVANPHVKSLHFSGNLASGGAAQLAAAPELEKLSLDIASAEETSESVQRAWQNAGKSLVDLTIIVRPEVTISVTT